MKRSKANQKVIELLQLLWWVGLVVCIQLFISAILIMFPFAAFVVAVKMIEVLGNVLWPGLF